MMARQAREKSALGVYFVNLRAEEKAFDFDDQRYFLDLLVSIKGYDLLSYTLVDNSFAFIIHECEISLELLMRKLTVSFANYYNRKHQKQGNVFIDRYQSKAAHDKEEILYFIRDIKVMGQVFFSNFSSGTSLFSDPWLSKIYFEEVLNLNETNYRYIFDLKDKETSYFTSLSDSQISTYIELTYMMKPNELINVPRTRLNEIIKSIMESTKASARQISRITTIPLRYLWNVAKGVVMYKKNGKE